MRALLRGDSNSIINEDLFNTPTLRKILDKLVNDKRCSIQELEQAPQQFVSIFCRENVGPLDKNLVNQVWSFLSNYNDLTPFGSLPILKPLWTSFKRLSSARFGLTLDSDYLSKDIVGLKRLLVQQDVSIFPQSSFRNHRGISRDWPCNPVNILRVLQRTQGWERTFKFTADEANILRQWVLSYTFPAPLHSFLGNFKIWDSYSSDPGAPLISAVRSFLPTAIGKAELNVFGSFPNIIKYAEVAGGFDRGILRQLGAQTIHAKVILTNHVVPAVQFQPGGLTQKQKITYRNILTALWRDGYRDFDTNEHALFLSSEALIPRRIGNGFAKGSDLLRPEDGLLQDFFGDEQEMFPDETVWEGLRQLNSGEAFGLRSSDDEPTVRRCAEMLLAKIARLPIQLQVLSPTMNASIGSPVLYDLAVKLVKHIYTRSRYQENMPGLTKWGDRKWAIVPAELATGPTDIFKGPYGLSTFMAFSSLRFSGRWKDETWTTCAYYPADLEPPGHFTKIHPAALGSNNISEIIYHFRNLVVELTPTCKANDRETMVDSLFKLYQRFDKEMKEPDMLPYIVQTLELAFKDKHGAFILNGRHLDLTLPASWRKPSELALGIEHGLFDHQPVHSDLLQFRTFLAAVGVRKLENVKTNYSVKVSMDRGVGVLEKNLVELFERQDSVKGFMDIKFILSDHSSGIGLAKRSILAHKFVLANTCDCFLTRFTDAWSAFAFTTSDPENPGLTVVDMTRTAATEAKYDVFWGVLYYLYTDKLAQTDRRPLGATTTTFGGEGTANTAFTPYLEMDGSTSILNHYQSITAIPAYRGFSFEELRLKDYQLGYVPKTQGMAFGEATMAHGENKGQSAADKQAQYLMDLLDAATRYHLERLKSLIANSLMSPPSLINLNNAFKIRKKAQAASQKNLSAYCKEYICKNQSFLKDDKQDEIKLCKEKDGDEDKDS